MMRIAFINPSVGFSDRRKSVPIGLAYIISYLHANGFSADGYDFGDSIIPPVTLVNDFNLASYDFVGFSVYNESFFVACEMAREIKRVNPECIVAMGGPQATATHTEIIDSFPEVDVVIRREGELPTLALIEGIIQGQDLASIPSLTWRRAGETVSNEDGTPLSDLDSLPFPAAEFVSEEPYGALSFYDSAEDEFRPALSINTSRSCPYNCSFCGVLTIGRKYRVRTAASVVQELEFFRQHDDVEYRHVYFSDANFFVRHRRSLEIAEALHAFDPRVSFSFGTRVNQVLRARESIEAMVPLGLKFVELGVESASPAVLERLSKGVGPEVNVAAIRMLNRLGVEIALDFIMVDPATTLADIGMNLDFLEGNGFEDYYPHDHLYTSLVLYEGTPVRAFYEERLNRKFTLGALPETRSLFEDPAVLAFWDLTQEFRAVYQGPIDAGLAQAEELLLEPVVRELLRRKERHSIWLTGAQLQLDVAALRHAPTRFFRRLHHELLSRGEVPSNLGRLTSSGFGSPSVGIEALLDRAALLAGELTETCGVGHKKRRRRNALAGALH